MSKITYLLKTGPVSFDAVHSAEEISFNGKRIEAGFVPLADPLEQRAHLDKIVAGRPPKSLEDAGIPICDEAPLPVSAPQKRQGAEPAHGFDARATHDAPKVAAGQQVWITNNGAFWGQAEYIGNDHGEHIDRYWQVRMPDGMIKTYRYLKLDEAGIAHISPVPQPTPQAQPQRPLVGEWLAHGQVVGELYAINHEVGTRYAFWREGGWSYHCSTIKGACDASEIDLIHSIPWPYRPLTPAERLEYDALTGKGWVAHDGSDKCPVPPETKLAAFRQGTRGDGMPWECNGGIAGDLMWSFITAYKLATGGEG